MSPLRYYSLVLAIVGAEGASVSLPQRLVNTCDNCLSRGLKPGLAIWLLLKNPSGHLTKSAQVAAVFDKEILD